MTTEKKKDLLTEWQGVGGEDGSSPGAGQGKVKRAPRIRKRMGGVGRKLRGKSEGPGVS